MSVQAVAPVTMGTLVIGSADSSYGNTSATCWVNDNGIKLVPKQQVSAFVSASLNAAMPGRGSSTVDRILDMIRLVTTVETPRDSQRGGLLVLRDRSDATSLRPPIIEPPPLLVLLLLEC